MRDTDLNIIELIMSSNLQAIKEKVVPILKEAGVTRSSIVG